MGHLVASTSVKLLNSWDGRDCIAEMVFDTTASNTGDKTATCVSLPKELDRALFCLACRHYIGETILRIWEDQKIETSKAPEVAIFNRF